MTNHRILVFALALMLLLQGCLSPRVEQPAPRVEEAQATSTAVAPTEEAAPPPTVTPVPASVEPSSTPAPAAVTITVIKGQIYIRRGPGLPYNPIGVLKEGSTATIIGQDVLSRWVQVRTADAKTTGWISIMTEYTRVEGDLSTLPNFTFTEWPQPAYIKNCTEHDLMVEPDGLYLFNLYANESGRNEVQVNPGTYSIVDLFVEGEPVIQRVEVREGTTAYVTVNGLGETHKCP